MIVVIEKLCVLSDMELMLLSCFNTEFATSLNDIRKRMAFNHATLQRAKKVLDTEELLEASDHYMILEGNKLVEKKTGGREKAYKLKKDLESVELLLQILFISTKIHNNVLLLFRELFPYKGDPADFRDKIPKIRKIIDYMIKPRTDYEASIADLDFILEDLGSLLNFDNKASKLRKMWWNFQGIPVDDYNRLKEAFQDIKNRKGRKKNSEQVGIE